MNKCYNCGKSGHFSKNCPDKTKTKLFPCDYCNKNFDTLKGKRYHENIHCKSKSKTCGRCGRNNHDTNNCFAKTTIKGIIIGTVISNNTTIDDNLIDENFINNERLTNIELSDNLVDEKPRKKFCCIS